MCICDLKVGEEEIVVRGCWNDLYIARHKSEYFIVASGEGEAHMKINYCPKCGKNLEEE